MTIWIALAIVGTVALVFIFMIIWLSRLSAKEAKSTVEAESLKQGRVARKEADEIMAAPVAAEPRWLERLRNKHHNG